jgi:TatD DNase family protein
MIRGIDAHIHLDMYTEKEVEQMLTDLPKTPVLGLIAVSRHFQSCIWTRKLRHRFPGSVYAAYGYHPEQNIPAPEEIDQLMAWILAHSAEMVAVGEVGLPYYLRKEAEDQGKRFDLAPYLELLDRFAAISVSLRKPLILHAVYEDADLVCDLLNKHGVKQAHFHWFKGSESTIERMISAGYYISVTPDVHYEADIRALVERYPLELLMAETDGPWPFEGPFEGIVTHPGMIVSVIKQIAQIKKMGEQETAAVLLRNTRQFYQLDIQ